MLPNLWVFYAAKSTDFSLLSLQPARPLFLLMPRFLQILRDLIASFIQRAAGRHIVFSHTTVDSKMVFNQSPRELKTFFCVPKMSAMTNPTEAMYRSGMGDSGALIETSDILIGHISHVCGKEAEQGNLHEPNVHIEYETCHTNDE